MFSAGKREIGTQVAELCSHALLALEVLMHPRVIPLGGVPSSSEGSLNGRLKHAFSGNVNSAGQENNASISTPVGIDNLFPNDDLYASWLGNVNEIEATQNNDTENIENAQEHSVEDILKAISDYQEDDLPLDGYLGAEILGENHKEQAVEDGVEMGKEMDDIMAETQEFLDPLSATDACTGNEMQVKRSVSESGEVEPSTYAMKPSKDVLPVVDGGKNTGQGPSAAIPVPEKADEEPAFRLANKSFVDPFDDIIDVDSKPGAKSSAENSVR